LLELGLADDSARASVCLGDIEQMDVVAVRGDRADEVAGGHVSVIRLPEALSSALARGETVLRHVADVRKTTTITSFAMKPYHALVPLRIREEVRGTLSFASDGPIPDDLVLALETLGSQVSVWLARREAERQRQVSLDLLQATDRERAALVRHLVVAQEDERRIIAGDIHDDSVQKMSAVAIRMGALRRYIDDPEGIEKLSRLETTVASAIDRLRRLMFSLRPPALDREGLAAAIRDQLAALSEEAGFGSELVSSLDREPSPEVRVTAFRIVQEALSNVQKHANAQHVVVELSDLSGGVHVVVRDDGEGLDPDNLDAGRGHLGMTSMRERAELTGGWFNVSSQPDQGTTVSFLVRGDVASPVEPEAAA
jgi:signal transduction histidine kinase